MRRPLVLVLLAVLACGGEPESLPLGPGGKPAQPVPGAITILAGDGQSAAVANMVRIDPVVEVRSSTGQPLLGVAVDFTVTAGDGWVSADRATTNGAGVATVAWYMGPRPGDGQRLVASVSGYTGLTRTFTAAALPLKPDSVYLGRNGYIELDAGALPVIISAPHGGTLKPAEIPDRTYGVTGGDRDVAETATAVSDAFARTLGRRPFVVIARLHRSKLDANREVVEAAQGHAYAIRAWKEWHGFLQAARAAVETSSPSGFYVDLHGHDHAIPRLELGYLLTPSQLALPDAQLSAAAVVNASSVRTAASRAGNTLPALLHGPNSLGTLLQERGFAAVPSATTPSLGNDPYYNGGYNTALYGSAHGGSIDGVQIETHYTAVRDNATSRERFGTALVGALQAWWVAWYGRELR